MNDPETPDLDRIVYAGPSREIRLCRDEAGVYYSHRNFQSGNDRVGVYHRRRKDALLELAWDLAAELEAAARNQ